MTDPGRSARHSTPRPGGPTIRSEGSLALAAVLVLLSLGLPWRSSSTIYLPGTITPGFCYMDQGGYMTCDVGTYMAGMIIGAGPLSGLHLTVRVFLVAALVLIVLAAGRRSWLLAAAVILGAGLVVTGLAATGGQIAALGAILLILRAVRRPGTDRQPVEAAIR